MDDLVPRLSELRLAELMKAFRVVIVNGPRQAGKTTLMEIYRDRHGGEFLSLDDPVQLTAALSDPRSLIEDAGRPLLIDEVQRAGDPLVLSIKWASDRDRRRGQFILSGSAQFLTVPKLSESLAGRAAFLDLWPFSMAERTSGPSDFCDLLLTDPAALRRAGSSPWKRSDYLDLICGGSYPEVISMSVREQREWFDSYLRTVISRDIREFAHIQHGESIPRLLNLLAARAGSTAEIADLARSTELTRDTIRNYLAYLNGVFLTANVPAWSTNLSSRAAKAAKPFLTDSGLAAFVLQVDREALRAPGNSALGGLLETFAFGELTKLRSTTSEPFKVYYFRDRNGREVDFILERYDGRVAGIEIKATASPTAKDATHLRWLRDSMGERFVAGVVLHLGEHGVSLGDRIQMLPLSALWGHELP
ncbi:ATP-binding protein [Nonomuraea sp. NPDC050404]|uniref:ATP-binding protein n=1 Tax=Nonomuraea sp. NPDC050404 TaxID=3155783 RepID=UPI00340148A2